MVFIYYSQGVASQYQDFTERLMSHLALKGTEITGQVLNETTATMHVKHTDEQGQLDIAVENENVKVTYTVEREKKEISKGVAGAVAGAGLGGLIGNILRHDQGVGDALAGALGALLPAEHTVHTAGGRSPRTSARNLPQCLPRP